MASTDANHVAHRGRCMRGPGHSEYDDATNGATVRGVRLRRRGRRQPAEVPTVQLDDLDNDEARQGRTGSGEMTDPSEDRKGIFLEVGIWLLFFALLVPAGLVGYVIGRDARPVSPPVRATAAMPHQRPMIDAIALSPIARITAPKR
jgi:hypothetical protein